MNAPAKTLKGHDAGATDNPQARMYDAGAWRRLDLQDEEARWVITPPCGHIGQLSEEHEVEQLEDGTISVDPTILCRECGWHGHLERGTWKHV